VQPEGRWMSAEIVKYFQYEGFVRARWLSQSPRVHRPARGQAE